MMKYITSCIALMIISACHPSASPDNSNYNSINDEFRYSGVPYVFKDSKSPAVIAVYVDEGLYRSYADISELGHQTDIGGAVSRCNGAKIECINIGGSYIMAPQEGVYDWSFSNFIFKARPDEVDPGSLIITSSSRGIYQSIYKYNKVCGVEWIAFAYRDDLKHEIYRPVGRSLFSGFDCSHVKR